MTARAEYDAGECAMVFHLLKGGEKKLEISQLRKDIIKFGSFIFVGRAMQAMQAMSRDDSEDGKDKLRDVEGGLIILTSSYNLSVI